VFLARPICGDASSKVHFWQHVYGEADPLYEVGVGIGRLLRTVFLADYFVNPVFRRELLRVLNRGEATNALKRLIYTGRVANYQAKSEDEMQAVADALSLLANIVMTWNTAKMQVIFDRWAQRRSGAIPPELIARIAPTRTEGINMRGIFRFPIEQYADQLLPSGFLQRFMFWGDKFAPTKPKNADLDEQQKPTYNHPVTRGASKNTGKYAVFLPSLLEAKMRGPLVEPARLPRAPWQPHRHSYRARAALRRAHLLAGRPQPHAGAQVGGARGTGSPGLRADV